MKDAIGMHYMLVDAVGTVGEDVLAVHRLVVRHNAFGDPYLWPRCGAGADGELVTEWLRAVNCPECLAMDQS